MTPPIEPPAAKPPVRPRLLRVHTARVSYGGPDRLDVTAAGARAQPGSRGLVFAPSYTIVMAAKTRMAEAEELRAEGRELAALSLMEKTWATYVPLYEAEMRKSFRAHRRVWEATLDMPRQVFVCFCTDHRYCHRTLLAQIFVKLGATYEGEIA